MKRRLLPLLLFLTVASAAEPVPSYLGVWKIDSAAVAPWWTGKNPPSDVTVKALVGKTLTLTARSIAGPAPLACPAARLVMRESPAEGLFQGNFDEMKRRNPAADPGKIAASVGFRGSKWQTLETGCEGAIDFHFLDANTAAFALDNYIYKIVLRR